MHELLGREEGSLAAVARTDGFVFIEIKSGYI
jgi:hypothetical protein